MRFLSTVLALVAALAIAHGGTPTVTYEHAAWTTPAVQQPINEDDPGWVCWTMGNRMCSRTPLAHRDVAPVTAVCSTDADCAAYDRSRGVISDGRP